MSIANEFITGGINAKQMQDLGAMIANLYKGALKVTGDEVMASHVTGVFVIGMLRAVGSELATTNKSE